MFCPPYQAITERRGVRAPVADALRLYRDKKGPEDRSPGPGKSGCYTSRERNGQIRVVGSKAPPDVPHRSRAAASLGIGCAGEAGAGIVVTPTRFSRAR